MKKSLFAVAAATAFVGAAQAQSSVSVYGIYDGGYVSSNLLSKTAAGVDSRTISNGFQGNSAASSRIGFRGTEDLGGGRSAIFNLELGVTPGDGTIDNRSSVNAAGASQAPLANQSSTGTRTSMVGISDKALGTVSIGRRTTGIHNLILGDYAIAANNLAGYLNSENFAPVAGGNTVNNQVQFNAVRMNNGIYYESPTISGLNLRVDFSNDGATTTTAGTGNNISNLGVSAAYRAGTLAVKAGTHTVKATQGQTWSAANSAATAAAATATTTTVINAASVGYSLGKLGGEIIYAGNKTEQLGLQVSKVTATQVALQYREGNIMPFARYGMGKTEAAVSVANADTMGYQVGAQYFMSKRTSLYAIYGMQENKVTQSTTASNVGHKTTKTDMGVGILHTF
jgi:predicted porin